MKINYGPNSEIELKVGNLVKFIPVSGGIYFGVFLGTSRGEWPHDAEKVKFFVDGVLKEMPTSMVFRMRVVDGCEESGSGGIGSEVGRPDTVP